MILDKANNLNPPSKDPVSSVVINKIVGTDNPPAYSPGIVPIPISGENHTDFSTYDNVANANPSPSVQQIHIFERKSNIQGTYFIDPLVPNLNFESSKHKNKSKRVIPHASFHSRKGSINLELSTTGDGQKSPKANVGVSTRFGDINIRLLPMPPSRPRIGLEVESRKGNISLFLPVEFSGVVHLKTRKGSLEILPAISQLLKIVKSSEHEVIFMIGTHESRNGVEDSREASFCEVTTFKGNIAIGLADKDHYSPHVGFWKKIGGLFRSN